MIEAAGVLFFEYNESRLAYRAFGNGPGILLAFHGFGQSGRVFEPFRREVGRQFTVLAIDLFFHGGSRYAGAELLTKTDWQRLVRAFLDARGVNRFSLMGYSLGGRFALATAEAFADRLDGLILIAPDGITRNVWYRLATGSAAGRSLFRLGLRHLPVLHGIGNALVRLGLLNRTAMRFVNVSLSTPQQRRLVDQIWTRFRFIRPDLSRLGQLLNQPSVKVWLFVGAFDRIVPGSSVLPLTNRLKRYQLIILKTGHNHLIELAANSLAKCPPDDLPKSGN